MVFKSAKLRGRIVEKFNTISDFAVAVDCNPQTISQKLAGKVGISREEIIKWCDTLEIATDDIPAYFFMLDEFSESKIEEG